MRIILTLILLSTSIFLNAQSIKKADFLHSKGYHEEAVVIYTNRLIKTKKEDQRNYIFKKLMYCYNELHNEEEAYKNFKKINNTTLSKTDAYAGFQLLRSLSKYEDAEKLLKSHDSLKDNKTLINISRWSIDKISENNGSFHLYKTNLETNGHSFGYSLDNKGFMLFSTFISSDIKNNETETNFYDLYKYPQINDSLFDLKKSKKVIKDDKRIFYRGTPSTSPNKDIIYYTTNSSEAFKYNKSNTEKKEVSNSGENILKIYEYNINDNTFESLPINNNSYHNCFPHLYSDSVLFYSSSINKEKSKLDIYYIIKRNNKWSKPKILKKVNTFEDEVYPFVYENQFYFSSRGREGFGGMDIYSGELNYNIDGDFEVLNIMNVLQPLNSSKDDFAYYQLKDEGGYLSSNRKSKKGEDYIYYFSKSLGDKIDGIVIDAKTKEKIKESTYKLYEKKENKWVLLDTQNLGKPALYSSIVDPNTSYKISFESDNYYSEEVQLPNSSFEELRNEIKEFIKTIELEPKNNNPLVFNTLTNLPIKGAEVKIKNKKGEIVAKTVTDKNGKWTGDFNSNNVEIEIYHPDFEDLEVNMLEWDNSSSRMYKKSGMTPLHNIGDKMTFNNIYFEFDSSKIRPKSYKILNNIVQFMEKYPEVKFELGAHTDCVGPNNYNERLSSNRAHSCWRYLISAGIDKSRIEPKGYGERIPLHPCSEQREDEIKALLNRRIEMTILK